VSNFANPVVIELALIVTSTELFWGLRSSTIILPSTSLNLPFGLENPK
jgi:hypothetical protein